MSQIKFRTERGGQVVEVLTGWDRPLKYYFLSIFGASSEPIWSGLDHFPGGGVQEPERILEVLTTLQMDFPPDLLEYLTRHEGNVIYTYTTEEKDADLPVPGLFVPEIQGRWVRSAF